jgi:acetyltransferase-like isoleucine patch superfamily enzyme
MPPIPTRLTTRLPQLAGNYPFPKSFYFRMTFRCAILKTVWYSLRFRGIVVVGRGSRIRVARNARVSLGPKSMLVIGMTHDTPGGATLRMEPRSQLRIDGRVQVMRAARVIVNWDATLAIGDGSFFMDGSSIICSDTITVGAGCAISWGVFILDTDIHRISQDDDSSPSAPVSIGRNCWIGVNAMVLKGTRLGDGSVVAAGAVVTRETPQRSLVAGVPARVIRENVSWKL